VAKQGKNIDDLHYVVDLLQAQLPPDFGQQLNISFTTLDGQFPPPAVTLPAERFCNSFLGGFCRPLIG
jgi:hypothetical protein